MKTNKKRRFWTVLCIILGVILALLLALTIAVNAILNKIPRYDPVEETISEEEIQQIVEETDPPEMIEGLEEVLLDDLVMPSEPAVVIEETDHIYNILLIGQDRRPGEPKQRSDAMILCTVNTEKKTLVITSFLRDTYVPIPDFGGYSNYSNRLNICYAVGGMELLDDAMMMNFGVDVDHNIEVDFSGFENVVNVLGGIDIYLTAAEASHMGGGLKEGMNHLDGTQALAYSRIRVLDSDFGRTNRQRNVLIAMFESIRHMNLTQISNLVNAVFPMVTTDMTNEEILKYTVEFFPLLSELQITTQRVPTGDTYYSAMIYGMAVLVPDLEANREFLRETLGE